MTNLSAGTPGSATDVVVSRAAGTGPATWAMGMLFERLVGAEETAGLLRRLTAYPGVPPLSRVAPLEIHAPVLGIHFRKADTALRVFTTIATLGTPQDVTLQEIRIECFFPSDAASAALFRQWAGS